MAPRLPHFGRRRALRAGAAAAVLLGLLSWWLVSRPEPPAATGRIAIATGVRTGVYARYGALLKEDLARDLPALHVGLRPSKGSLDNLRQLASGEADFTIATADSVADYLNRGLPGARQLRACARLYDDYIQLVVRQDSPVRSVRDLKGLRVGVGAQGSGVQPISRRLLTAAGLDFDRDISPVQVGIDRSPGLLESGKIDAFFWSGGLPTGAIQTLGARLPIRLVQLDDLIGPLHRLGRQTRFYRAATMPADAYRELGAARTVKSIAVPNLLVTMEHTDPVLTELVTRTVIQSRDRIGAQVHAAQLVDLRTAVFTDPLPLHAGARRYYVSVKP
ncbi:TAXI family TRAP transporter solute-binding subunit [Streptomyces orinoci]|uniref:TAXI family TRAP transporter solute-binding subunit n=1 Tax=Streptomyces orinoci TaxID=67339 RepID=A0ABV3K2L0_STRON|nr:TAXI family TRAP transporter solute-binding subunit [Streptomyces orinoci]